MVGKGQLSRINRSVLNRELNKILIVVGKRRMKELKSHSFRIL